MNSSTELVDILENILNHTSIDPNLKPSLQNGLSLEEIELKISNFPLCVPEEFNKLYQWHDGMDTDCGLFQYYRFLPLDVSLEARNWWMEFNNTNFTEVYKPDLLPLFEFENEFYCIQCS